MNIKEYTKDQLIQIALQSLLDTPLSNQFDNIKDKLKLVEEKRKFRKYILNYNGEVK